MNTFRGKLKSFHSRAVWAELFALACFTTLMCVYIAPSSFAYNVKFMLQSPLLLLLNALPVAAVLLLIYFVCQNSFIAGGVTNLVFGLMNYANLLKIDGRDDPFVPGDIALLREALQATGEYRLDMHLGIVALIVLTSAAFIFLGVVLGRTRRSAKRRVIGAVLTIAVFFGSFFTLYRSSDVYASFPVSTEYNITSVFNELGFNYCFLYNFDLYSVDKPEDYSASEVEQWISAGKGDETPSGSEKPQVLMIMCEAFSDLNESDVFTYSEEENPLYSYWQVKNSPNSISGRIVVPNFGAGTANTEFDVLTGMQTNLISRTSNSAMRSFHGDIPSVATAYSDAGYSTFYMHPGDSWFYNRDSALSHLGIDDKVFVEDLENKSNMDDVFLENLTAQLESRTQGGEKLFTYATTIQNHQSYTYAKYDYDIPRVECSVPLSAEAEEYLSVYSYGVKCSSDMLLEMTEYLNGLDEPYILVFFGDHLPNLGADYLGYRELGLNIGGEGAQAQIDSCSVPFVIWANDAYLDGRTMAEASASLELPADGRISACFLGELALELSNVGGSDNYFDFLARLRRTMPVIKNGVVGTIDGTLCTDPSEEQLALIRKLNCWQYYRMT